MQHSSGHIRDAFSAWVEQGMPKVRPDRPRGLPAKQVACREASRPHVPLHRHHAGRARLGLDMESGSTYAQASQRLLAERRHAPLS